MKVIFLDVDGVLNSLEWDERSKVEISEGVLVDESKVKLLAHLVRRSEAKVILHSGWRFWFDAGMNPLRKEAAHLSMLLEKEGVRIDGVTPDLTTEEIRKEKRFSQVKAEEILTWLKRNEGVTEWVVIDDLDLHNDEIGAHQIKTDARIGLTKEKIKKAEKMLGMTEN